MMWASLIVLAIVTAYGFLFAGMRLTKIEGPREFSIVVTDARADESYRVLTVEGCSADHTEDGVVCNTGWYGRADREWWAGSKQVPVPFRDAPRGPILRFEAVVRNRAGKSVASASMITARAR